MPKTNFDPLLDGFSFTGRWEFSEEEADGVRKAFMSALGEALEMLKPFLGAVTGFYDAARLAKKRIESGSPRRLGCAGGMVFAALDFYKARGLLRPAGSDAPKPPENAPGAGAQLRAHILRRERDNRAANFATLLAWMTMLHDIPEKWLPHPLLLNSLEQMIEGNELFRDVDIEIDLKEPFPGGAPWSSGQSLDQWETLKNRIDADEPWPIRLIGDGGSLYDNRPVLALGYKDAGEGIGEILVYDVNSPGREHSILLDFRGRRLSAEESFPDERRGALRGFFCEAYSPVRPMVPARHPLSIFSRDFLLRMLRRLRGWLEGE